MKFPGTTTFSLTFVLLAASLSRVLLAGDFPGIRGPLANGMAVDETHLSNSWPEAGPPLLWRSADLGVTGWDHDRGQVAVADGRVYVLTRKEIEAKWLWLLTCLDEKGGIAWQYRTAARPATGHQTPSPTPCVASGRVFASSHEKTFCLDAKTGEVLWENPVGRSGLASPVAVGDVVVFMAKPGIQALSQDTGELAWEITARGTTGILSPTLWPTAAGKLLVAVTDEQTQALCVDPKDGRVVWDLVLDEGEDRQPSDKRLSQAAPTAVGEWLLISRIEPRPLMAYRIDPSAPEKAPTLAWWSPHLRNTPLIVDGFAYVGYTRRTVTEARCIELASGEVKWEAGSAVGKPEVLEDGFKNYGDPVHADGKNYVTMNKKVFMFRASPEGLGFLGKTPDIGSADTSSPAISNGRLYVLCYTQGGAATVACFDISGDEPAADAETPKPPDRQ